MQILRVISARWRMMTDFQMLFFMDVARFRRDVMICTEI